MATRLFQGVECARTSSMFVLKGFSHSTWRPFLIPANVWLACTSVLVEIHTAWRPG